jgi:hypothetical protein
MPVVEAGHQATAQPLPMAVRAAVAMAHPITPTEAQELPILAEAVGQAMDMLVEQLETENLAARA